MQTFLLELGKGFAFIGRQYPIVINNIYYHVDLVFYHRILKCFVLFDLKKNSVKHEDIGQINSITIKQDDFYEFLDLLFSAVTIFIDIITRLLHRRKKKRRKKIVPAVLLTLSAGTCLVF